MNMNNRNIKWLAASVLLLLSLGPSGLAASDKKPQLAEKYKTWLDEEVGYIITGTERDVFKQLTTDRERDMFIEAFWKHRDPNPMTEENEFKTEHYRRIQFANRYLGRETPIPGWKTDRGRMYILLGEPREKVDYTGSSAVYDCETWFYQEKTDLGLPAGFYLLFFRPRGNGQYRLYSPIQDGPQALLQAYTGDSTNYTAAYNKLYQSEETLAGISICLVPGEPSSVYGRPSMTSDLMLQKIETVASKMVETTYARKFLEYKDVVEVDYSANYIDSDSLVKVFRDPSGYYFLHLCVEPKKLSVSEYENKYFTNLDINCRISDAKGRSVYQFDRRVPIQLTAEQLKGASYQPFDFHDIFPMVPGDYGISLLFKNEASKEFTSIETKVRVPGGEGVQLTQPLLGYKLVRLAPEDRKIKAFRIGSCQLYCQPSRVFTAGDTMAVAFQVILPPSETAADGQIKIAFYKEDVLFREITHKPSEYPELPNIIEEVALKDFTPAHYRVVVSYTGTKGELSASEEFDLTYAEAVPRPWSTTRILPDTNDAFYPYTTGTQLLNQERYQEAKVLLDVANRKRPDLEEVAYSLARADMALKLPAEVRRVLAPFVAGDKTPKYETVMLTAEACAAGGDHAAAVTMLERAVSHYGVNAAIMNGLGDNYLAQGRNGEALAAYRKSLELSPDQPDVKKKIQELDKKK